MTLTEVTDCPVCGSRRHRPIPLGEAPLVRCRGCGLVYSRELVDPEEVYGDGYLTGATTWGVDTTDPLVEVIGRAAARRRYELLEAMTPGRTILDVGCGSGEALDEGAARGWSGVGVELGSESTERARARGLDVRTGRLGDVGLGKGSFDVVAAWHVLEHQPDPVGLLREMAQHVRPGGLLAVEVPNWNSSDRRTRGADWDQLCIHEHLVHFTPRSLRRTMRSADLRPRVRTVTVTRAASLADRLGRGFALLATAPGPKAAATGPAAPTPGRRSGAAGPAGR